jgi:pimeloyl-ACP methyl ester carboxylesterase
MSALTVVLVHGGGGCPEMWDPVIVELRARRVDARAADLPTARRTDATLAHDVAHVREIASGDGPTILCGHSWGGTVITEAGMGLEGLVHLVYLAAFMPDRGETTADWGGKRTMDPPLPVDFRDDGTMKVETRIVGDSDQRYDAAALERIAAWPPPRPFVVSAAITPLRAAAWHDVPSTYVVASRDSFLHSETQREMATRATRVMEVDCDHDIMAVCPEEIAEMLASLATNCQ